MHRHLPAPEQPAVAVGQEALLVAAWEGLLVPVVAAWEGLLVPVACLQLLEQPEAVAVCSPKVPREPQAVPLAQVALPLLAERRQALQKLELGWQALCLQRVARPWAELPSVAQPLAVQHVESQARAAE